MRVLLPTIVVTLFVAQFSVHLSVISEGNEPPLFTFNLTRDSNVVSLKNVNRRLLGNDGRSTGLALSMHMNDEETAAHGRRLSSVVQLGSTAPLFEGLGTHYSFIWVGTPPQRVSVIMDTGSHHTAFPCVGCKCGKHMDPSFDPQRSSSASIRTCGAPNKKCFFRQSYTEGSSWHAFKVKDKVWLGGPGEFDIKEASKRNVDFEFGCLDSETGLFRTQKVDGIMGLSAAADTLPYKLLSQQATTTRMFGLCFRQGGGVVTLGGIDTSLHAGTETVHVKNSLRGTKEPPQQQQHTLNRTSDGRLYFAKMLKPSGWYTVRLMDVLMRPSNDDAAVGISIGGSAARYNTGKGTIVDSGTTDTYLPSAVKAQFLNAFKSFTGRTYSNSQMSFTKEQFAKLPVVMYRLQSAAEDGSYFDVDVFPSSYLEKHKSGMYTPRIYLTEGSGTVLGANTINEHNVIFDPDKLRIGFAKSSCSFDKPMSKHDFHSSVSAAAAVGKGTAAAGAGNSKPTKVPFNAKKSNSKSNYTSADSMKERKKPFLPKKKARPKTGPRSFIGRRNGTGAEEATYTLLDSFSKLGAAAVGYGVAAIGGSSSRKNILSTEQQHAIVTSVAEAAEARILRSHDPCSPSIAVACKASCAAVSADQLDSALMTWQSRLPTHRNLAAASSATTSNSGSGLVKITEYLTTQDGTGIAWKLAYAVQGQQIVKVPLCSSAQQSTINAASSSAVATAVVPFAADFLESIPYEMKSEQCVIQCAVPEQRRGGNQPVDTIPVRIDPNTNIDSSWSECFPDYVSSNTSTPARIRNKIIVSSKSSESISVSTSSGAVRSQIGSHCYNLQGSTGRFINSNAVAVGGDPSCSNVELAESACLSLQQACTPRQRQQQQLHAAAVAVQQQSPAQLLVTIYLRLQQSLSEFSARDGFSRLSRFQKDDIRTAFADIFQLTPAQVEITAADVTKFPFSYLASTPLQVHVRTGAEELLPGSVQQQLPLSIQQLINRIGSSSGSSNNTGADIDAMRVLRLTAKEYVLSVVQHPRFPAVFSAKVAAAAGLGVEVLSNADNKAPVASTVKNRNINNLWMAAADIHFAGVTVRAPEFILSGAESSPSSGCEAPPVVWTDYYGIGGSLASSSLNNALFSEEDGAVMRISDVFSDRIIPLYGEPFSYWWYFAAASTLFICLCTALHLSVVCMAAAASFCPLSIVASVPASMQLDRHRRSD